MFRQLSSTVLTAFLLLVPPVSKCWSDAVVGTAGKLIFSPPATTLWRLSADRELNGRFLVPARSAKSTLELYGDNPFVHRDMDTDAIVLQLWIEQHSGDYKRYVNGHAVRIILHKALKHWWYKERHSKFELDTDRLLREIKSSEQVSAYKKIYHYWLNVSDDEISFNMKIEF